MPSDFKEVEVRFLEIDKLDLIKKLKELGAKDLGEKLLKEVIFSDSALTWFSQDKLVRVRDNGERVEVAYKHHHTQKEALNDVDEVEFEASSFDQAKAFLEQVGLVAFRQQEKRRHTFKLGEITFDIDSWPGIPPYLEIEGPTEESLKKVAEELCFDWSKVVFEDAAKVLINNYNIPVKQLKFFTFERIE